MPRCLNGCMLHRIFRGAAGIALPWKGKACLPEPRVDVALLPLQHLHLMLRPGGQAVPRRVEQAWRQLPNAWWRNRACCRTGLCCGTGHGRHFGTGTGLFVFGGALGVTRLGTLTQPQLSTLPCPVAISDQLTRGLERAPRWRKCRKIVFSRFLGGLGDGFVYLLQLLPSSNTRSICPSSLDLSFEPGLFHEPSRWGSMECFPRHALNHLRT